MTEKTPQVIMESKKPIIKLTAVNVGTNKLEFEQTTPLCLVLTLTNHNLVIFSNSSDYVEKLGILEFAKAQILHDLQDLL